MTTNLIIFAGTPQCFSNNFILLEISVINCTRYPCGLFLQVIMPVILAKFSLFVHFNYHYVLLFRPFLCRGLFAEGTGER